MADLRMFTLSVAYHVDVMLKVDELGHSDTSTMESTLIEFGARNTKIDVFPYTGAGTHEFVGSVDPGLAHLAICVKCTKRRSEAAEYCPGVGK